MSVSQNGLLKDACAGGPACHGEAPTWGIHEVTRTRWFWAAWKCGTDATLAYAEPWKHGCCLSRDNARIAAQQAAGPSAQETLASAAARAYEVLQKNGKLQ